MATIQINALKRRRPRAEISSDFGIVPEFPGTKFHAVVKVGKPVLVNLSESVPCLMAEQFSFVIWKEASPLGQLSTQGPLRVAALAARKFMSFVSQNEKCKSTTTIQEITPEILDSYEKWLKSNYGEYGNSAYDQMGDIRRIFILAQHYNLVSTECASRLEYISTAPTGSDSRVPRDAYTPFVANQIKTSALAEYDAIVKRMTIEGPGLVGQGADPFTRGEWTDENLAWAIFNRGVGTFTALSIPYRKRNEHKSGNYRWQYIRSMFHLGPYDVYCLSCLISLITGIPIEAVKELHVDCLNNESNNFIDIKYIKRRSGKVNEKIKSPFGKSGMSVSA